MVQTFRHAIVTGGSSGIGLAVAKSLIKRGGDVTVIARTRATLNSALAELMEARASTEQHVEALSADVADRGSIESAVATAIRISGAPDLLVLSAGICHPGYVSDLTAEIFERTNAVNYLGSVYPILSCLPTMINGGRGHIVLVSSGAGLAGIFGYTPYSPTKFALRGLAESLRAELTPKGLRVSIVYPPDTDTPQLAYENQYKPEETKRISGTAGLWQADDVAHVIMKGVDRQRFSIPIGMPLRALDALGGLLAPVLRWQFDRLAAPISKSNIEKSKSI